MIRFLQRFIDIADLRNIRLRHIVQSILVFSCFCTLDTIAMDNNNVWLISATMAVVAIAIVIFFSNRIYIGKWTNTLNLTAAAFCIGCHFTIYLFPVAIFFTVLVAGIRLIYARSRLNTQSTLLFVITSVFAGIILRFAFILLPVWALAIIMLATIFNPVIEKESNEELIEKHKNLEKLDHKHTIVFISVLLVAFLLCIEVFGGPLTDEVADGFPMDIVNLTYLAGYLIFIAVFFIFRTRKTSVAVMSLCVIALFFFLIPTTTTFGIYFLLFLGGGIKVLMLAFPLEFLNGRYKYLGALSGVLIYRLAFLASGVVKTVSGGEWSIASNLTYSLAAVNIVMGIILIFLLAHWDKQETKRDVEKTYSGRIDELMAISSPKILPEGLTERELEIVPLILESFSRLQIAQKLFISEGTVKNHITNLLDKTNCISQKDFIIKYK